MADKKRSKKRKDEYTAPGEELANKPTKEEYKVAKWLRKNVPIKKTKFLNHNVEYFTGKRAVDALLESNFAKGDNPTFKGRDDIVDLLHVMLEHKFYHRARKVPVTEQELKGKKKEKKKDQESGDEEKKGKKEKEQTKGTDAESSVVEGKEEKPSKEKLKKKIRLEMHNDQRFVDSLDAYVWIYDPIPFHYWIIGTFLVLGAIAVCLFPLWPPGVRLGVYYISVAAACFLVSIIVMAVIRLILFCLIWMVTFGRHHLWILPNLTEDVGFFASFWPLYKYEYKGPGVTASDKKKKKKKKDKDSDAEDDKDGDESGKERDDEKEGSDDGKRNIEDLDDQQLEQEEVDGSESESESKSSTGKDFEMVDHNELEDS